jgi:hypothetical protein
MLVDTWKMLITAMVDGLLLRKLVSETLLSVIYHSFILQTESLEIITSSFWRTIWKETILFDRVREADPNKNGFVSWKSYQLKLHYKGNVNWLLEFRGSHHTSGKLRQRNKWKLYRIQITSANEWLTTQFLLVKWLWLFDQLNTLFEKIFTVVTNFMNLCMI